MNIIYMHTSPSGKCYIGKTKRLIEKRLNDHVRNANNGIDTKFCRAIRKYSIEQFDSIVLENNVDDSIVNDREKYWIEYYDAYKNGYNSTIGGDGGPVRLGMKNTKEMRMKNSIAQKGKPKKNKGNCGKTSPSKETRKVISEIVSNTRWVNDGINNKKVSKCDLDEFLNKNTNWKQGRTKITDVELKKRISESVREYAAKNPKVWVCNKNESKMISKKDLDSYLKLGYKRGIKYNEN